MRFRATYTSVLLLLCSTLVFAGDFNANNVDDALERAKEYETKIELPEVHDSGAQKAAQQAAGQFHSPEYRKKIQAEIERLKSEQFSEILKDYEKGSEAEPKDTILPSDERLYIFISSSVPLSTLRTYASELDKLNDSGVSMVMRGFVGGMKHFKPTLELVRSILLKDSTCDLSTEKCDAYNAAISIDPLVFRKYGIERVPAIAYVRGASLEDVAMSEDVKKPEVSQDAYIVYGDVSVGCALETIAKETKSDRVNSLIKKLRKGFYAH